MFKRKLRIVPEKISKSRLFGSLLVDGVGILGGMWLTLLGIGLEPISMGASTALVVIGIGITALSVGKGVADIGQYVKRHDGVDEYIASECNGKKSEWVRHTQRQKKLNRQSEGIAGKVCNALKHKFPSIATSNVNRITNETLLEWYSRENQPLSDGNILNISEQRILSQSIASKLSKGSLSSCWRKGYILHNRLHMRDDKESYKKVKVLILRELVKIENSREICDTKTGSKEEPQQSPPLYWVRKMEKSNGGKKEQRYVSHY